MDDALALTGDRIALGRDFAELAADDQQDSASSINLLAMRS